MNSNHSALVKIFYLMAEQGASDIYVSGGSPVLIKINGVSVPIGNKPISQEAPLKMLSEVLPSSMIETLRATGELNTAFPIDNIGNFRISALRQRGNFAFVVRYIAQTIPNLESLNVPSVFGDLIMSKRGLILMVGTTGSGKSTTLASMIDYRNERESGHILTVENPIEYVFINKRSIINQRDVGSDTESLEVALRNGLRQAPDVIMIGEIRDRETMSAALTYAQSGHLCVATLHANNSYFALNRILSFYPVEVRESMLGDLAASLKAIVSQRLVKTLDGSRLPAVEVLLNTKFITDLIIKGDFGEIRDAMEKSMTAGSQTFEQDLARMVNTDLISRDEAMLYADSPSNLLWRLENTSSGSVFSTPEESDDDVPNYQEIKFS